MPAHWSLSGHRSTADYSVCLRPLTPNYTSQDWRGEPSLVLFHQRNDQVTIPFHASSESAVPPQRLCGFSWRVCSGHQRQCIFYLHHMWLGEKSCFHTKEHFVFRSIRHKILPDKSFTMPSLARNTPICFPSQLLTCTPHNANFSPFLSHFSEGPSAQTTWMFRFCRCQKL